MREFKKMVGVVLIVRKISPKLKRLQVNQSWSSLRYLAKTSLFSAFLKTEKNFQLKQNDRHSETTAKCPKKDTAMEFMITCCLLRITSIVDLITVCRKTHLEVLFFQVTLVKK